MTHTHNGRSDQVELGAAVETLGASLRGPFIRPGDENYETARKVWNGLIDKRPALIVRCAGAADVIQTVNFARTHNLLIAVRGGGHSVAGNAVCDGGIVIDLSSMKGMRVNPASRNVRAEPGLGTLASLPPLNTDCILLGRWSWAVWSLTLLPRLKKHSASIGNTLRRLPTNSLPTPPWDPRPKASRWQYWRFVIMGPWTKDNRSSGRSGNSDHRWLIWWLRCRTLHSSPCTILCTRPAA